MIPISENTINRNDLICLAYNTGCHIRANLKSSHNFGNAYCEVLLQKLREYRYLLGKDEHTYKEQNCFREGVKAIRLHYEGSITEMERTLDMMFEVLLDE